MTDRPAPRKFDPPPRNMDMAAFVARFGGVFEHSPWIAEGVYRRGLSPAHDTPAGLATAMNEVLAAADHERKLELIRAHPDLAGLAAIAGDLTAASKSEQAGAGLDQCTPDEFRRFQELNEAYKKKFGFPFILAVSGRNRREILTNFEPRIGNEPSAEFDEALRQIRRIALMRLEAMVA
jgi:2-oxo-4-hydroxy-4-carboxy-5-ureidoimidazoline decarboxylase